MLEIFGFVLFILYFVPTIIAFKKGKKNKGAITALNIILGWTFVGWIIAFIWSLTQD